MIDGEIALLDGQILIPAAYKASNAFERARGLLFRAPLGPGQALIIEPCSVVHTAGMRYPLDLLFLDHMGVVLKIVRWLKPWRLAGARGAKSTVETTAGESERLSIKCGMRLSWRPKNRSGS